jgi:hypothetical protein
MSTSLLDNINIAVGKELLNKKLVIILNMNVTALCPTPSNSLRPHIATKFL